VAMLSHWSLLPTGRPAAARAQDGMVALQAVGDGALVSHEIDGCGLSHGGVPTLLGRVLAVVQELVVPCSSVNGRLVQLSLSNVRGLSKSLRTS